MEQAIDDIASDPKNRIPAIGTLNEFLSTGSIKETAPKFPHQEIMLTELLKEHETIISSLRKNIDVCDEKKCSGGTSDFLTNLIQQQEAIVCILRRYMNKALLNSTI